MPRIRADGREVTCPECNKKAGCRVCGGATVLYGMFLCPRCSPCFCDKPGCGDCEYAASWWANRNHGLFVSNAVHSAVVLRLLKARDALVALQEALK